MNFFTRFLRSLEALAKGDINRGEGFGTAGRMGNRKSERPDRVFGEERKAGPKPGTKA